MLWIEGHPAVEGLADPTSLAECQRVLLEQLDESGLPRGRDGGLRRVDATVTLATGEATGGRAILAGLAGLGVPGCKPVVQCKPAQTVYLESSRSSRKLARVYDKGIERGNAQAGELLRFEDQRRYVKERWSSGLDYGAPDHVAEQFRRRFGAMAASASGMRVQSLPVLERELAERVNGGEVTRGEAERLIGFVALERAGARPLSAASGRRRRAGLRDRGLVLADEFYEPVDVDLAEPLEAVLAAW